MGEAKPVHIANLTIQHFPKTAEGQALIGSQEVFCLAGALYQGYKGDVATVFEKQISDEELEAVHDVDGTKDRIWTQRKDRLHSRDYRKAEELTKRENIKNDQKRRDLELLKLERELSGDDPAPVQDDKPAAVPPVGASEFACEVCGKEPPEGHKKPKSWRHAHKLGSHRK